MTARQRTQRRYYATHHTQILAALRARRRARGILPIGSPAHAERLSVSRMRVLPGHCQRCGIDTVPCPYCAAELAAGARRAA
ncbi:MAG: hypothetical protein ACHQC8_02715 [Solirubrobacterales bacterium]